MKIIRPESEKKEVPLVSGGVYTDQDGEVRVIVDTHSGSYAILWIASDGAVVWSSAKNASDTRAFIQEWTYHPNAELVLEPKR